jgi:hypothetical protein
MSSLGTVRFRATGCVPSYLLDLSLACVILLLTASSAAAQDDGLSVRAGFIEKTADGEVQLYRETTEIPFITAAADPRFRFGVVMLLPGKFMCRVVLRAPRPQEIRVNPSAFGTIDPVFENDPASGARVTLESAGKACSKNLVVVMQLDEGDSPGIYAVDLFVDETLRGHVDFDVQPPVGQADRDAAAHAAELRR